jgi:CubicO group peptidase (beta-lactamase class C family)
MTRLSLDRRHLLMGLGATSMAVPSVTVPAHRAAAAPSSEEFQRHLAEAEQSGKVHDLHALLVSQGGRLLFEHYGKGEDEGGDSQAGVVVTFGPEVLHDLRSVSKSVVGLAYGIALADGKVPPPEAKLYEHFPEYADLAKRPGRDRLTIGHVLSMTLGFEWDEFTIPYGTAGNSENAMEAAPDRFRFILDRPIVGEPGVKWTYCGGATAILGRLIGKGTGEKLPAYARRVLFDPIGFGPSTWRSGDDGEPRAASGCRLLPRDMLKVGQLALAGGAWQGKQIVPADWVKQITTPAVKIEGSLSYGYHWYIYDNMVDSHRQYWFGGIGWGGQRLYVFPLLDLVIAMNSGNYGKTLMEQNRVNLAVLNDVVFPSLA